MGLQNPERSLHSPYAILGARTARRNRMAAKSEALARQFEAKVQAAVATLERVSDAEWTRVTEAVDAPDARRGL